MTKLIQSSFLPPAASKATRKFNLKSNARGRAITTAFLPAWDRPRKVVFESLLELSSFFVLLSKPNIWDLWEQPPRIRYWSTDDEWKWAFFDFLITLRDQTKIAIAVKPAEIVEATGFRRELELVRAATPLNYADKVCLVTDRSFPPAGARNAERLHEFRKIQDEEADEAVCSLISSLKVPTKISDIIEQTELKGRAFRAAFRAIYSGAARRFDDRDITPATTILAGVVQ